MNIPLLDRWSNVDKMRPFLIKGGAKNWKCSRWNARFIGKILTRRVAVRFGKRKQVLGEIQFEKNSPRATVDYSEFLDWCENKRVIESENGHGIINWIDYWGYIDYKYMRDEVSRDYWNDVEWSELGIDRNGEESTLWIGTPGAYSPSHYDTMGWNLHLQLNGSKRWILAPPISQSNLMPTRIPYEETTVYSTVDLHGDPNYLSGVDGACVFYTDPGDVIFVPPLWWHAVQCQGRLNKQSIPNSCLSISINTWISDPRDKWEIVKEAITACMISQFIATNRILISDLNSPHDVADDWIIDWQVANVLIQEFGWRSDAPVPMEDICDNNLVNVEEIKRKADEIKVYTNLLDPFLERFSKKENVEYGFPVAECSLHILLGNAMKYELSNINHLPFVKRAFNTYEAMLNPNNVDKILCKLIENPSMLPDFL